IEILKVYSEADIKLPSASVPEIDQSEATNEIDRAPDAVRALYRSITSKGGSVSESDFVERFLSVVPSDLTMEEVDRLTQRLKGGSGTGTVLQSLSDSIAKLRAGKGSRNAEFTAPEGKLTTAPEVSQ